jgi:outer membrane receptor protein involved in Fe transport
MIEMRLDEEISMMRVGFSVSLAVLFNTLVVNAAVATEQTRQLEEIVVTAVKREQDLQDVPVSVTAYSDELREELALDSIADFARLTPSLAYSSGDDRVFVRGVGRQTNTNGSEPGVATYSDGIYDSPPRPFPEATSLSSALKYCAVRRERCTAATRLAARSM